MKTARQLVDIGISFILLVAVVFSFTSNVIYSSDVIGNENIFIESVTSGFMGQLIVELNEQVTKSSIIFSEELQSWQEINSKVSAILSIPDFNIKYPVIYSDINHEYLRKDIYNNYSKGGELYFDANYKNEGSPMRLIHGHNMRDGTKFAALPQMLNWDTLELAPLIYLYDKDGLKVFRIFSVYSVNSEEETLIVSEYSSLDELQSLQQEYIRRSWPTPVTVLDSVEMLMLNTCWYGASGNDRHLHCIVVASRVE